MAEKDPFGVADRNYLIIGGTTGLGLSAARALVREGARVFLVGRSPESLDSALKELGKQAQGFTGDATDSTTVDFAMAGLKSAFGPLDGLYHVAGGSGRSQGDGPLHDITDEGLDYTLQLNLNSLIYSNRAAVRQFREEPGRGGVILNMGSVLGYSPSPQHFASHAYAAAKSAILGFSKSIAAYYADQNIRVNVIAPALVATPMSQRAQEKEEIMSFIEEKQPLDGGRIGSPQDLDEAALYLLGSKSRFVTGQVLAVDGGWTVSGH